MWDDHVVATSLERGTVLRLGRGADASVRVDHSSVSRLHAELRVEQQIYIRDLGSSNGLRIAGRALAAREECVLEPGQIVSMGAATLVVQPSGMEFRDPVAGPTPTSPWPDEGPMAEVVRLLRLVARGNVSVLLTGETGCGKEVAAEFIHRGSKRFQGPFVRVNCAALPETLIESELFGHERGAFTGAASSKRGLFEAAEGGTLFLDEVGELPLAVQSKLLRALDTGETQRLGAVATQHVNVRIISATNRPLTQDVAAGRFRQDLFFRLAGMPVELPPLRRRRDEIEGLARLFLRQAAQSEGHTAASLSPESLSALRNYDFPGNARELRNMMERAMLLSGGGAITPAHLMLPSAAVEPATDLKASLKRAEKARILDALQQCGGNQTQAAKQLGIGRRTLIDKMHEHGIHPAHRR
jgi:transcriptional regulator with PAS, ATPase and Fis domain